MRVTIITVCFNSEAYIGEALASIDAQAHPDIEHIVIDGASRDGTLGVVAARAQPWRRVVSEPDKGIYDAMNKGLAMATGDYIGFLNADDVLADPQAVTRLVACARTGADALYSDLVYVRQADTNAIVRHWKAGHFSLGALQRGWMPPHPTFYLKRDIVHRVGRFDTGLRIAADYEFMLRALTVPGIVVRHVPGVLVRMRTGGASNRSVTALWRKSSEDLRAMRRHRVGGVATLLFKNLRKVPQFLARR